MKTRILIFVFHFLLLLSSYSSAQEIKYTGRVMPAPPGEKPYLLIPFYIPDATEAVEFRFTYDKTESRLDFGVFDERSSGSLTDKRGFRGWSGAVRDDFFIARREGTNGYANGPILGPRWYVIVGKAKVPQGGVQLSITVSFGTKSGPSRDRLATERKKRFDFRGEAFPVFPRAKAGRLTWYAGDLHVHTFHGDGSWTVEAAIRSAQMNGLNFVALTEHNTFSHHREIDSFKRKFPGMVLMRGQEVTTYGGHMNAIGLPSESWVDFRRVPSRTVDGRSMISETRGFGAIASINHPTMGCSGCSWTYGEPFAADSIEVWNATWDSDDEAALKIWDALLNDGYRITAIGSTDSHQPPYEPSTYPTNLRVGDPAVFIGAVGLSEAALLEGIRKGRVFVAETPRRSLTFRAGETTIGGSRRIGPVNVEVALKDFSYDARLLLISDGAEVASAPAPKSGRFLMRFNPTKRGYLRLEVRAADGKMLAFTNPIYFR